jgi:murein L,D-transpeptidase YafK
MKHATLTALFLFAFFLYLSGGVAQAQSAGKAGEKGDLVVIHKARRWLELYNGNTVIHAYHVALGFAPEGAKTREGDGKTPEGIYRITRHNPGSKYHLSLLISYPEPRDSGRAILLGKSAGGEIMIHGLPNDHWHKPDNDWTDGCIALTDSEIEQIYNVVPDGTMVIIEP